MDLTCLEQDEIKAWVPFSEDTKVQLAYITRDELKKIMREATILEVEKGKHVEREDDDLLDELMAIKAVQGWDGFTANGKPYLCTPENIKTLMKKFTEFGRFVRTESVDLSNFIEKKKAEKKVKAEKN